MNWKEFTVYTSGEAEEAVANVLNEHGANGVAIADIKDVEKATSRQQYGEIYEISTDEYPEEGIQIKAYFHEETDWPETREVLVKAIEALRKHEIPLDPLRFEVSTVQESDWENEWKNYFHVQHVTDRLIIVPSWETYEGAENELLIHIDPGMAFGTGTHPTTILSLEGLEKYMQPGDQVLDVGVGSGILSIGACLLGAGHVYGYDLDPVAVKSAVMNRDLNHMQEDISLEENDLLKTKAVQADLIVSNILAEIIVDLVDDAYQALRPGGCFITSGIIQQKESLVEGKLISSGFRIVEKAQKEQWISIIAQKKENDECSDIL